MMGEWNHDMSKAPRGRIRLIAAKGNGTRKVAEFTTIIAASACGVVTLSRWLEDEKRWEMFTPDSPPMAWMLFAGPTEVTGADGKTRQVVVLPAHPTVPESWFQRLLRERVAA